MNSMWLLDGERYNDLLCCVHLVLFAICPFVVSAHSTPPSLPKKKKLKETQILYSFVFVIFMKFFSFPYFEKNKIFFS